MSSQKRKREDAAVAGGQNFQSIPKQKREDTAGAGDQHLQSISPWLQGTPDIALVVQGQKFLAHGLLLAMHSRILAEAMACSNGAQLPKEVPLDGDSPDTIQSALSHIYRRGTMSSSTFKSHLESSELMAVQVALFAHKYDAAALAEEAEDALTNHFMSRSKYRGLRPAQGQAETTAACNLQILSRPWNGMSWTCWSLLLRTICRGLKLPAWKHSASTITHGIWTEVLSCLMLSCWQSLCAVSLHANATEGCKAVLLCATVA